MANEVHQVTLPSRGLLYEGRLQGGEITMRPLTTQEEKILARPEASSVIDNILEPCILTEGFPYDEYLVGDKSYMLFMLRNISYGGEYRVNLRCSQCNGDFWHTLDVPDDLQVRVLEEGKDEEPYEVDLPACGKHVALRHLRVRDEKWILRTVRRQGTTQGEVGDPGYILRLARHIVSIDGEDARPIDAIALVEDDFSSKDSLKIRNEIDSHRCGVDLLLDYRCAHCGNSDITALPMNAQFFRPGMPGLSGGVV